MSIGDKVDQLCSSQYYVTISTVNENVWIIAQILDNLQEYFDKIGIEKYLPRLWFYIHKIQNEAK